MIASATKPTGSMKKHSDPLAAAQSGSVKALVLAGARATGDVLAQTHDVSSKAHIKVAGKSMMGRVLDALDMSARVDFMTVIGLAGHEALRQAEAWPTVKYVAGLDGPAASVSRALERDVGSYPVLVTTCDHALLTPTIIDAFLNETVASEADLTVALARREDVEARYPGVSRTYLHFGDGAYSSCNLFCLKTPKAAEVVRFWQSAERDRKRPWRIAWRFGLLPALRILVGRPGVDQVFAILSERLGVKIRPVLLPFADAAVDVDTVNDLALVERVLAERNA